MKPLSIVGVFCEDIREEKSGQDTLVGIFPDNLNVAGMPGAMSKLAIYIRLHFDASLTPPKTITAKLVATDGSEMPLPSWDTNLIGKGFADAVSNGLPLAGFILRAVMSPLPVQKAGVMMARLSVDGEEYTAANLRIAVTSSSTAPVPPAAQSQPASQQTQP